MPGASQAWCRGVLRSRKRGRQGWKWLVMLQKLWKIYYSRCLLRFLSALYVQWWSLHFFFILAHLRPLTRPCPKGECPGVVAEVCGSDGSTYLNLCFLRKEACKFPDHHIKVKSIGHCGHTDVFDGIVDETKVGRDGHGKLVSSA